MLIILLVRKLQNANTNAPHLQFMMVPVLCFYKWIFEYFKFIESQYVKIKRDPEIKQMNPRECKMHHSLGVNTAP